MCAQQLVTAQLAHKHVGIFAAVVFKLLLVTCSVDAIVLDDSSMVQHSLQKQVAGPALACGDVLTSLCCLSAGGAHALQAHSFCLAFMRAACVQPLLTGIARGSEIYSGICCLTESVSRW